MPAPMIPYQLSELSPDEQLLRSREFYEEMDRRRKTLDEVMVEVGEA